MGRCRPPRSGTARPAVHPFASTRSSSDRDKPDTPDGSMAGRVGDKAPNGERPIRQSCAEGRLVRRDPSPRGRCRRDHQDDRNSVRLPSALGCQANCQPLLPVEWRERPLHVGNHGFDLDDEQRAGWPMPGQNVDRSTLAVDRKRHLGNALPGRDPESRNHTIDDRRVVRVEESVGRLAVPVDSDDEPGAELLGDGLQVRDREAISTASFHARDQCLREARFFRQVDLPPAAPDAKGADHSTDARRIHQTIKAEGAYRRLIPSR